MKKNRNDGWGPQGRARASEAKYQSGHRIPKFVAMKGKEGNGKRTCRRCMGLAAFWAGDLESHQDTELTVTVPRSKYLTFGTLSLSVAMQIIMLILI